MQKGYFKINRVAGFVVVALCVAIAHGRAAENNPEFSAWIAGVKLEASERGISTGTLDQAFTDLEPIPRVIELDRQQPEFTQTFSRYLRAVVTDARVTNGRAMMQQHAKLLAFLEWEYGVPGRFLVAFWGLESNYGVLKGEFPVVGALATLSFDGRRGAMFRRELFDALTILDRRHITVGEMKGSWAGAMGHTQFMPSNFLAHAVDQDGNERIDLWNSVPDALGSAANYLRILDWKFGFTWGREIWLPDEFDIGLVSVETVPKENKLPLSRWAVLGVKQVGGHALPHADILASLVMPEGSEGPAFLVYDNYNVILEWNRSTFYAIAVGHLADRLVGAGQLSAPSSTDEPLTRAEAIGLQQGLIALGFLSDDADGIVGSRTRRAIRSFQSANSLVADSYADRSVAAAIVRTSGVDPNPEH